LVQVGQFGAHWTQLPTFRKVPKGQELRQELSKFFTFPTGQVRHSVRAGPLQVAQVAWQF
jgi:hypothetical protein